MTPKKSLDFYCQRCKMETSHSLISQTPNYLLYQCRERGCCGVTPIAPDKYEEFIQKKEVYQKA